MWVRYNYGTNDGPVLAGMPRVETSRLQDLRIEVRIFSICRRRYLVKWVSVNELVYNEVQMVYILHLVLHEKII
jgi:hypothetical protein